MTEGDFHGRLKYLIHDYILLSYKTSAQFPKSEIYGMTSQVRRAALSVMLNYVEGYSRVKPAVMANFFEISFASLKESIYVFYLAKHLSYIDVAEYEKLFSIKEEVARMLWRTITGIKRNI